ncbi:MAG: hypothetical protein MPJ25_08530, partial [Pirellulales bacterium]|nr:hypothetical protein [Pirellulales bacterium]
MAIKTKSKLKAEKKFSFLKDKSAPKQEFDYWSLLYKKVNKVDDKTLTSINKKKGFEYGYNEEHDFVCISHDGTVGEFYNIQGLVVGIPKAPKKVFSRSKVKEEQYWDTEPLPNEKYAKKIKNMRHFSEIAKVATPQEKKLLKEFVDVDGIEWERRTSGFWFMNDGTPTYVTGSHYFYLRWAKIDVGSPDYREANKIFFYFWEACKADRRSYGMCYLKNRRSGFSFMASSEIVNTATQSKNSQLGIMSKTGIDAKSMFVNKVVPISLGLPFFFKPIRSGEERPKTILEYSVPSTRLTRNKLMNIVDLAEEDEIGLDEGLDTTISWKNTGDNAYDGEKLKFLSFDEIGKLEKPNNIKNAWLVHKTCLELGSRIVGKCMAGSTCNAQDKGGREFKELYNQSNLRSVKRDANGQTPSGLYSLFIPMEFGTEGFIDIYGRPIFKSPKEPVKGIDGGIIKMGVVDHWENKVKGLKAYPDSLNEYYRQYPRTEEHAFRDEAGAAIFNLNKIYEQIDFNSDIDNRANITRGNFQWVDGLDSKVKFYPSQTGRFYTSWIPETRLQ